MSYFMNVYTLSKEIERKSDGKISDRKNESIDVIPLEEQR